MELINKIVQAGKEDLKKQPKVSLEQALKQIQKVMNPGTKRNTNKKK